MRVQPAKVFADTINGLGGVAVPMAWGEVIPAAQQGVIDGADLPIVNILALKAYEVSKYCSMTYHNYGPTAAGDEPRDVERSDPEPQQKLLLDASRAAQEKVRELTESVDTVDEGKGAARTQGHDGQRRRCRGLPQDRAGEGLAGLQEAISPKCGTRSSRPRSERRRDSRAAAPHRIRPAWISARGDAGASRAGDRWAHDRVADVAGARCRAAAAENRR